MGALNQLLLCAGCKENVAWASTELGAAGIMEMNIDLKDVYRGSLGGSVV